MTVEIFKVSKNGSSLSLEWSDGEKSNFNFMWLRDNCPTAPDKASRHRMFNILEVSTSIEPKNAKLTMKESQKQNGVRAIIQAVMTKNG